MSPPHGTGPPWLRPPTSESEPLWTPRSPRVTQELEPGARDDGLRRMAFDALHGYLSDVQSLTPDEQPGWIAELYRWPTTPIGSLFCDWVDLPVERLFAARDRCLADAGLLDHAYRCTADHPVVIDRTPLVPLTEAAFDPSAHPPAVPAAAGPAVADGDGRRPPLRGRPSRTGTTQVHASTVTPAGKRQWVPGIGWITRKAHNTHR